MNIVRDISLSGIGQCPLCVVIFIILGFFFKRILFLSAHYLFYFQDVLLHLGVLWHIG